jgi:hypothetical protein
MLASASAGMIARIPCHPLDTCKARLQAQVGGQLFSTVRGTLVQTVKREGFGALYKGFGITMLGSAPATCLYLTSYEAAKGELRRREFMNGKSAASEHFVAGMLAEMISCVLFVPIDVIKVRVLLKAVSVQSSMPFVSHPVGSEGAKGEPPEHHTACRVFSCTLPSSLAQQTRPTRRPANPSEHGVATAPRYHCSSTRSLSTMSGGIVPLLSPPLCTRGGIYCCCPLSSPLYVSPPSALRCCVGRSGCKSSRRRCCAQEHRGV